MRWWENVGVTQHLEVRIRAAAAPVGDDEQRWLMCHHHRHAPIANQRPAHLHLSALCAIGLSGVRCVVLKALRARGPM